MRHWPFIGLLAVLAAGVVPAALQSAPWPFIAGLALAAGAPLAFIAHRAGLGSDGPLRYHPLGISIISGAGCVLAAAGHYRFDRSDWIVWCALAALVIWMAWQRWVRVPPDESSTASNDRPQEHRQ